MLNLLCILLVFTSSIKCSGETAAEFAKRTFRHKHEGYWKTPYTDFSKMWQEWREQQEPIVPTAEPTLYEPEIELERQPTLDDVQYDIEYVDVEQIIEARKQTEAAFLAKGEPLAKPAEYSIDEQIQNFEKIFREQEAYVKQLKKYNALHKKVSIDQIKQLIEIFLQIKEIFAKINKLESLKKEENLEYADQIKKYQEMFKNSLSINRFVDTQIEKSQYELKKEIAFWEKKISDQKDAIKKLTKQKQTKKVAAAKKILTSYQARVKEENANLKKLAAMASDYRSAMRME